MNTIGVNIQKPIEDRKKKMRNKNENTQFQTFQTSMRVMLIFGQCLGLNPFLGVTKTDITKVRFTMCSARFLYAVIILFSQIIGVCFCFYRFMSNVFSVAALGYLSFYISTASTTLLFLKVAHTWPRLLREIYTSELNEFIDYKTKIKSNTATIILFIFAITEHILASINRLVVINNCKTNETVVYEEYIKLTFPWLAGTSLPKYLPLGIFLELTGNKEIRRIDFFIYCLKEDKRGYDLLNLKWQSSPMDFCHNKFIIIVTTMNWNYSDLFVICISMYLTGILEKINEKVLAACKKKNLTPEFWCLLREAYNRATRLVRYFDDVISGIIFTSFAINLFFICLQLFNVLSNGVMKNQSASREQCPNHIKGPFRGYEYAVYLTFSLFFLFGRFLAVSLYASRVHTASQQPAPALYEVPSCMYCEEVQRFIDQVHGDNVALSGLNFFYVTRELALSMAATIVTYELVLLQVSSE